MQRARVRPERIEFEVTETVLLDSDTSSLQVLRTLKSDGFQIALDDFGTGYSSLSYLKLFPFDRIKIDRSFVSDIADNPQSAAIVTAVTHLAHALDMKVTAEGIETAEQYGLVASAGCDAAQGYFIGKSIAPAIVTMDRKRNATK
jgi:EAL domain-containing protein (putative c-di-GMP-specific phosphodiesterase class I)